MNKRLSNDIFSFVWRWYFLSMKKPKVPSRSENVIGILFKDRRWAENFRCVWRNFFHLDISKFNQGVPSTELRNQYDQLSNRRKYEFLEFAIRHLASVTESIDDTLSAQANKTVLAANNASYRFIGENLVPITNPIDKANLSNSSISSIDAGHIERALIELHRTENRNTSQIAAEAFAGVESALKTFLIPKYPNKKNIKNMTAGELLDFIKDEKIFSKNPTLAKGMSTLYGFDSQMARHGQAATDPFSEPMPLAQAVYILEVCSALINYVKTIMQDSAEIHSTHGTAEGDREK